MCVSVAHNRELRKTAEPIEMPFGVWTRVGPRNHVLSGGPDPPKEGAIFWGERRLRCVLSSVFFDRLLLYHYRPQHDQHQLYFVIVK